MVHVTCFVVNVSSFSGHQESIGI